MKRLAVLGVFVIFVSGTAQANTIQNACMGSERAGGDRALCNCIQGAADRTLTQRDQRLAATFFGDPGRAQEIRQSSRRHHEAFWERYRKFGTAAETFCRS